MIPEALLALRELVLAFDRHAVPYVVRRKLDWYRKGGEVSERQLRDVVAVIKVQGNTLDLDYVRRMASLLDLTSLLQRALIAAR